VRSYDRSIEYAPQFTRALLARATVLFDQGKHAAAERDINTARRLDPRSAHAHYLMSLIHAVRNESKAADEALREADQILKSYDSNVIRNDAALTLLAGVVNYFRRDFDQAYVWISRYVETYPMHLAPRRLLASLELRLGNADRAIRLLQEVIRLVPDDFEAMTMYGDALMRTGKKAEAVEAYERAAAISPAKGSHFNELVVIRMLAGQDERAIESLKSAIDRRPGTAALLAAAHLRRGEYAASLAAAAKAIAAAPDDPTGHNLAAGAYLGLKDVDRARASFLSALAADGRFATALLNLARLERQLGRLAESKRYYRRYLDLNSDDGMAMIALADIAFRENDPADAVQWLRRGWTRSNARVAAAVRLINLYTELGRASDAIGLAQDLFNERPRDPEAVEALARARLDANLRDAAAETLRHMQEVSAAIGSAPWLQRTAIQQMRTRDYEGARASLNAALRVDPRFMPAHIELFRIEMSSNDYRAALARAEQLSARVPDDPTGAVLRGDLHMRRRNYPEAIRAYEEALDKQPSAPLALRLYHALNAGGKSGFAFLAGWVRERPDDPAAGRLLGVAYTDAGRIDDAIAAYETMLRRDAGDPVANNALALLYLRKNDPRAVTAARKAYEAASGEAAFLDTYGWVLVRRGEVEQGLKLLRNAHLRAPDVPEIRYHLAVALQALDQTEEAREELRAALRAGSGFDGADEARELLRRIGP
jgi:putative PEP-CTERM system TPR-repeat lipoprotein